MTEKENWIRVGDANGGYFYESDGWYDKNNMDLAMVSNNREAKGVIHDKGIPESEYLFEDGNLYVDPNSKLAEWALEAKEGLENYPLLNEEIYYELEEERRLEHCVEEAYECADKFLETRSYNKEQLVNDIGSYILGEMHSREVGWGDDDYPERAEVVRGYHRFLWDYTDKYYKPRPMQSVTHSMLGDGYKRYTRDGIGYITTSDLAVKV